MQRLNFSERNGLVPIPAQYEIGSIPRVVRNKVASEIQRRFSNLKEKSYNKSFTYTSKLKKIHSEHFLKVPSDFSPNEAFWKKIIEDELLGKDFNRVLDFIEFVVFDAGFFDIRDTIANIFEDHKLAYRLTEAGFIQIASEAEFENIKMAHQKIDESELVGAKYHLSRSAIALRAGQWADSIRESVHAVEATVSTEVGATSLGDGLAKIGAARPIHPALKSAFSKIYGYTSDEEGIRHALIEGDRIPTESEALFMFGACAAFITYLIQSRTGHIL